MIAGYTGTRHRATYTCIGDTVNVGARLESHTKEAGRSIVLDGATAAAVGEAHSTRLPRFGHHPRQEATDRTVRRPGVLTSGCFG